MARQQRFDWFLANQRNRKSKQSKASRASRSRRTRFESLETRNLLSVNAGNSIDGSCPENALDHDHDHDEFHPHVFWASQEEYELYGNQEPAEFNAATAWEDQDPLTDGIQITYSYSNFLDGGLLGGLTTEQLVAATEEALGLWASVTPLQFIEVVDSGPPPSDAGYAAGDHPNLRIGHHLIDGPSSVLAHAYFPNQDGRSGDVHFDSGDTWSIHPNSGIDVIEVMTHELGHSLGLGHETAVDAIMNPFYGSRYSGPDTGFLLDDDIQGIQFLYGEGEGGVVPLRLVVDTIEDENDGDTSEGDLSLREALIRAKEIDRAQAITFHQSLAGQTIVLDPALSSLVIDSTVSIEGLGSGQLAIEAPDPSPAEGDGFQIFIVDDADDEITSEVSISGLTLNGADSPGAGGAIYSLETLALQDIQLNDNFSADVGGAVYAYGDLSISDSAVGNNRALGDGGAVFGEAEVLINNSTLSNNVSGGEGGAIATEGNGTSVIIDSSTISGNTATGNGGGIRILDENPVKFRILHSTVYDNHADSDNNGTGTGGGAYMFDGVLALEHSIVAGNTDNGVAPNLDNINLFASPAILAKYSLVSDAAGSQITQQAPNLLGVDPQLEPLADNGGIGLTHKPLDGSPIVNAGDPNIPFPADFDQRGLGFKRIQEGVIDIGAVESGGFEQSFTVNTLVDKSDIDINGIDTSPEDLSLREAIELSNIQLGKNLIVFVASLNGGTISLNESLGELTISDTTTVDASDLLTGLTISGQTMDPTPEQNNGDGSRLLSIDDGNVTTYVDVEIAGLTFTGGDVSGNGGAIHSNENLTLQYVSILDNYADGDGGGLYHLAGDDGGTLLIENSTLANNVASGDGGGLWSNTNLPAETEPDEEPDPNPIVGKVINSTISGNVAGDEGGGIINFDGQLELRHVTVTQNQADHGSGVVSFGDTFTKTLVYSSIIAGNAVNENNPTTHVDDTGFDVQRSREVEYNSFESLGYNLIGIGDAQLNFNNNDIVGTTDPGLRPLGNYGGMTMTHSLLSDSPAIDSGDPNAILPGQDELESSVLVTGYDQRGEPFTRIADGDADGTDRMDIGAFEAPTPEPSADFDDDGDVDGADFLAWQRGFGTADAQRSDGDANFDGNSDGEDLQFWATQFGSIDPAEVTTPHVQSTISTVQSLTPAIRDSASPATPTKSEVIPRATNHSALAAAQDLFRQDADRSNDQAVERKGNPLEWTDTVLTNLATQIFGNSDHAADHLKEALDSSTDQEAVESLDLAFESLGLRHIFKRSEV